MNNSTINPVRQAFPKGNVLNITGSHEIISKLIDSGVDSERLSIDELGSIIVPIEFAPIVYALCPVPDYLVLEQKINIAPEQLRIQWKLREAQCEIDLIKSNFPNEIKRYDVACLKKEHLLKILMPEEKPLAYKNLSALRTDMFEHIAKSYDRGIIGLAIKSITEVNTEMYGLRGLLCLTAAPGCGKTALAVQWMLEAMETDDDVCGVFVSLEIEPRVIFERLYKLAADMRFKDLRFRNDAVDFTMNKMKANESLSKLEHRLAILGERECSDITIEQLIQFGNDLKSSTGCSKIFFVIDYLQLWPTHELKNKKVSDLEHDKWVMDKLKKIRDAFPEEPVLVISESRKPLKSGDSWAQSAADISGSGRFGYGFDGVLHITPATHTEILDVARINGVSIEGSEKQKKFLASIFKELHFRGSVFCYIHLSKMRGGEQFRVLTEFSYRKDKFTAATCINSSDVLKIAQEATFRN